MSKDSQTTPEQAFEEFMQSEQDFYDLKVCPFCKGENPSNPVCKTERSFLLAEVPMPEMREMLRGQCYGTPAYIAFDLQGRPFVYPLAYAKEEK